MLRLLLLATVILIAESYKTGAPNGQCRGMTPNHGGNSPKDNDPPYQLMVGDESIAMEGTVLVALRGNDRMKFKGFLIVARDEEGNNIGSMKPHHNYQKDFVNIRCDGAGITHSLKWRDQPWYEMAVEWTAPEGFEGPVKFRATVVKNYNTFWVGLEGNRTTVVTAEEEKKAEPDTADGEGKDSETTPPDDKVTQSVGEETTAEATKATTEPAEVSTESAEVSTDAEEGSAEGKEPVTETIEKEPKEETTEEKPKNKYDGKPGPNRNGGKRKNGGESVTVSMVLLVTALVCMLISH